MPAGDRIRSRHERGFVTGGPPARILMNRAGGTAGPNGARNEAAVADALRRAGIAGEPQWLEPSQLCPAAERAVADGTPLVIAGGGDGTVSGIAGVLAGTQVALGILPLGTLNHFARDLGIPMNVTEAAALIARGRARAVDVGEVNGRVFVNNSAIGLYPLMVLDREAQQRRLGRSKWLAMAVAALRTLSRFERERLTLTVEDSRAQLDTPLLFVGNNAYRLALPASGTRDGLDDGKLSVLLLRRKSRLGFLVAALRALAGRSRPDDLARLPPLERLKVESPGAMLALSIDGEAVEMVPPLHYQIRQRSLRVIAP